MLSLIGLWLTARYSGVHIDPIQFLSMWIRKVPMKAIVAALVIAHKSNLPLNRFQIEAHALAGGDVLNVVKGMAAAQSAGIDFSFDQACKADFKGLDVLEVVKKEIRSQK